VCCAALDASPILQSPRCPPFLPSCRRIRRLHHESIWGLPWPPGRESMGGTEAVRGRRRPTVVEELHRVVEAAPTPDLVPRRPLESAMAIGVYRDDGGGRNRAHRQLAARER
jgi:hypothetical protein